MSDVSAHGTELELRYAGAENLVHCVYDLLDVYAQLGWNESVNSGESAREIFDKLFRHFEVLSMAIDNSKFDKNGKVLSAEDDWLSVHHLGKALCDELKENPLR